MSGFPRMGTALCASQEGVLEGAPGCRGCFAGKTISKGAGALCKAEQRLLWSPAAAKTFGQPSQGLAPVPKGRESRMLLPHPACSWGRRGRAVPLRGRPEPCSSPAAAAAPGDGSVLPCWAPVHLCSSLRCADGT